MSRYFIQRRKPARSGIDWEPIGNAWHIPAVADHEAADTGLIDEMGARLCGRRTRWASSGHPQRGNRMELATQNNPAILLQCGKHRGAGLSSEQHGRESTGGISAGFGLCAPVMRMTGESGDSHGAA